MPLNIRPRIETILPEEQTRAVYECAVQAFLKLEETWARCPRRNREVSQWLRYFQSAWVNFLLLGQWLY